MWGLSNCFDGFQVNHYQSYFNNSRIKLEDLWDCLEPLVRLCESLVPLNHAFDIFRSERDEWVFDHSGNWVTSKLFV